MANVKSKLPMYFVYGFCVLLFASILSLLIVILVFTSQIKNIVGNISTTLLTTSVQEFTGKRDISDHIGLEDIHNQITYLTTEYMKRLQKLNYTCYLY